MVVPGAYCMVTKLPDRFLFLNFLSLKFFFKFGEKIEFGMRGAPGCQTPPNTDAIKFMHKAGPDLFKNQASGPMSSRARAV